jgi:hypothetical protein
VVLRSRRVLLADPLLIFNDPTSWTITVKSILMLQGMFFSCIVTVPASIQFLVRVNLILIKPDQKWQDILVSQLDGKLVH